MTIQESDIYRLGIIAAAKEWINGQATINNLMELDIIADYYNVRLPEYLKYFNYSECLTHVSATGAHKSILRVLKRLEKAIREKEELLKCPNE